MLRTRFTWYYILIIALIGIYSVYQIPFSGGLFYNYSTLYFSGVFGGYALVTTILGGISVSKSDQEYLLVSAVPKRQLSLAFLMVQALGAGLLLIAVSILSLVTLSYGLVNLGLAALDLALLDIFIISVGIAAFQFSRKVRVLIAVGIAAWVLSFLIGFPYSPQAFLLGNPLLSLPLNLPIAAVTFYAAVRSLSSEDLPLRLATTKDSGMVYRSSVDYKRYKPTMAVFMNGFTTLTFSTNSVMAGGVKVRTSKIRLRTYFIIMIIIAAVYGFLAYYLIPYGAQSEGFNFVVLFGALYAGVLPQFIFSSGVMIYERAWLSFTSIEPWRYLRIILASKILLSVLTSIPFVAVSLVDRFLGVLNTTESILVFVVLDPLLIGLFLFFAFTLSSYQITDEGFLSSRMSAAQFAYALPIIIFTVVVMVSILVPLLIAVTSVATGLLLLFVTGRKAYWERKVNRLVEKGYV